MESVASSSHRPPAAREHAAPALRRRHSAPTLPPEVLAWAAGAPPEGRRRARSLSLSGPGSGSGSHAGAVATGFHRTQARSDAALAEAVPPEAAPAKPAEPTEPTGPPIGRFARCARRLRDRVAVVGLRLSVQLQGGAHSGAAAQRLDDLAGAAGSAGFAERATQLRTSLPGVIATHRAGQETLADLSRSFCTATFELAGDRAWDRLLPTQALRLTDDINLRADLNFIGARRLQAMGLAELSPAERQRFERQLAGTLEQRLHRQRLSIDQFRRLTPLERATHLTQAFEATTRSFGVRSLCWTRDREHAFRLRLLGELTGFSLPPDLTRAVPEAAGRYSDALWRLESALEGDDFPTLYNGLRQYLCRGEVTRSKPACHEAIQRGYLDSLRLACFEFMRRHAGIGSTAPLATRRPDVALLVDHLEARCPSPGGGGADRPADLLAYTRRMRSELERQSGDVLVSAYARALERSGGTAGHLVEGRTRPPLMRDALQGLLAR